MLAQIKSFLRDTLTLPPDLVLLVFGLIAHLLLCLILRKPLSSAWGILAPVFLGVLIEGYEIWVHYRHIGLYASGNDTLAVILFRHTLDIMKMLMLPILLVAIAKTAAHIAEQ